MLTELFIALIVAWIYLTIVRFVDVNEREPLWALATAFAFGLVAAGLARALIDPVARLTSIWGPIGEETLKFAALAAAFAVFAGIARWRGWSEISDLVDGLVYGIAVGLGFSAGDVLVRELTTPAFLQEALGTSVQRSILTNALAGLAHGIFAAVSGLALGAAVAERSWPRRILYASLGLAVAIALNFAFAELAHGNSLAERAALYRTWAALIIPLIVLVAIGIYMLARERRAILTQLRSESEAGLVSPAEIELVSSFWRRQLSYVGLLLRGRVAECLRLAAIHNRQVQLALAKQRAATEQEPSRQAQAAGQVDRLRSAIRVARAIVPIVLIAVVALVAGATQIVNMRNVQLNAGATRVFNSAKPLLKDHWQKQLGAVFRDISAIQEYPVISLFCPYVANNAMYCKGSQSIYYDPHFVNQLHDTIGDMAPVILLAHEYGHRVQDLRGLMELSSGMWGIQLELQADCLAGEWARAINALGKMDRGDRAEALDLLNGGRDDWDYPWYDQYAHGTGGQRIDAFQHGFDGNACDGDVFWRRVRLDPSAASQRETPVTGSLIDRTAKKRGRFEMVDIQPKPELIAGDVTDAIGATFKSSDGAQVYIIRMALINAPAAERRLAAMMKAAVDSGFTLVKEGPVLDGERNVGRWVSLVSTSKGDLVVLRNRQTVELALSATGIAWQFITTKVDANQ